MNNRLKELMELNEAVDTVCKACDTENDKRRTIIAESYEEKWNKMWDDIERDILPVVEKMGRIQFEYEYHYTRPLGNVFALDTHKIKFYGIEVYFDHQDGKHHAISRTMKRYNPDRPCYRESDIKSYGFYHLYNAGDISQRRIKGLLDDWNRLYPIILDDLAKRMEEQIKKKLSDKEKETKELMKECGEEV